MALCGLVSGTLVARLLGPDGRGRLAALTLWPVALGFVLSLGIERTVVFFGAKRRDELSAVAGAALVFAVAHSFIVAALGFCTIPHLLRGYGRNTVAWSLIYLLYVPLTHAVILPAALLLGTLRTRHFNICRVIPGALYALGTVCLYVLHVASIGVIVSVQIIGCLVAAAVANYMLAQVVRPAWVWQWGTLGNMLNYGSRTHIGQLSSYMNQRLDQLLLTLFLKGPDVGIYVAAVAFAEALAVIPRAIGTVTLAQGSNTDRAGASRWVRRSVVASSLYLLPAVILLWFLSPYVIPGLLGPAFAPAVGPCRILSLGACASGLATVLYEAARSINRPEIASYAELLGLVIMVALLTILLKPYGVIGAALASTAASISALAFTVAFAFLRGNVGLFRATRALPAQE